MRYSLSSRFRGTFLGAAITPLLLKNLQVRSLSPQIQILEPNLSPGKCLAIFGTKSLIQLGRFDLDDWRYALAKIPIVINQHLTTTTLLATLPLALFYHDNKINLRQKLLSLDDLVPGDAALAIGYAIAQAMNEKLNPNTLISEIITFIGEPQTLLTRQLVKVQSLLFTRASLEVAVTTLGSQSQTSNIALAFYCFLSTLEDVRLSVMRASHTGGNQLNLTVAITGALSGAYNSIMGIPVNWQIALSHDSNVWADWEITSLTELLHLSDALLAVWSGIYDQLTYPPEFTTSIAIAAPRVIRPR